MLRKSKSLYIAGSAIIGISVLLMVMFALIAGGVVDARQNELVFASASSSHVYDGTVYTDDGWELVSGELRKGHVAQVSVTGSRTDAGSSENFITAVILDERGADVTGDYVIEYQPGTLTVEKRTITVTSASMEKEYDGLPLYCDEFEIQSDNLVENHTAVPVYGNTVTEPNSMLNYFSLTIYDGESRDKTYNYDIKYIYGTLTVNRRTLTIKTGTAQKEYDGGALKYDDTEFYPQIIGGELMDGDEIVYDTDSFASITEAGTVENTFTARIINRYSGEDVTDRYDIISDESNRGTLTITPIELTVSYLDDLSKQYDGTPLKSKEDNSNGSSGPPTIHINGDLQEGHEWIFTPTASITDVGEIDNAGKIVIRDKVTYQDVTKNYNITYNLRKLIVTKCVLNVKTLSGEKFYDGEPLTKSDCELSATAQSKLDSIVASANGFNYSITCNVSVTEPTDEPVKNYATFNAEITDGYGTKDVSNYFVLYYGDNENSETDLGTLKVNKRIINVILPDYNGVYNGTEQTFNAKLTVNNENGVDDINKEGDCEFLGLDYEAGDFDSGYGLINDHTLIFQIEDSQTNFESGRPFNYYFNVKDENFSDCTEMYYELSAIGLLKINKRDVYVVAKGKSDVYNDNYYRGTEVLTVLEHDGTISLSGGDINGDLLQIYDGLTNGEYYVYGAAEGHVLNIEFSSRDIPGTTELDCNVRKITDGGGNQVEDNYNINKRFYEETNKLIINKIPINVVGESLTKAYDGVELSYYTKESYMVVREQQVAANMLTGHSLKIRYTGSLSGYGEAPNTFDLMVVDSNTDIEIPDWDKYYEVEKDIGKLIIGAATITMQVLTNGAETEIIIEPGEGFSLDPVADSPVAGDYLNTANIMYAYERNEGDEWVMCTLEDLDDVGEYRVSILYEYWDPYTNSWVECPSTSVPDGYYDYRTKQVQINNSDGNNVSYRYTIADPAESITPVYITVEDSEALLIAPKPIELNGPINASDYNQSGCNYDNPGQLYSGFIRDLEDCGYDKNDFTFDYELEGSISEPGRAKSRITKFTLYHNGVAIYVYEKGVTDGWTAACPTELQDVVIRFASGDLICNA